MHHRNLRLSAVYLACPAADDRPDLLAEVLTQSQSGSGCCSRTPRIKRSGYKLFGTPVRASQGAWWGCQRAIRASPTRIARSERGRRTSVFLSSDAETGLTPSPNLRLPA